MCVASVNTYTLSRHMYLYGHCQNVASSGSRSIFGANRPSPGVADGNLSCQAMKTVRTIAAYVLKPASATRMGPARIST